MKVKISKLDAAKRQLVEAINLFFEERDPVSIHTLAHAALDILADYALAHDIPVFLHKSSPVVKEEGRKIWAQKINEAKNFFKHADKDIKNKIDEIEFESELNTYVILGALDTFRLLFLKKLDISYDKVIEYRLFTMWLSQFQPDLLQDAYIKAVKTAGFNLKTKKECADILVELRKMPANKLQEFLINAKEAA